MSINITGQISIKNVNLSAAGGPTPPTPVPVANFTANTTSGNSPLTVQFTDTSTNSPTSWAWDFTNDGSTDSTVQNPIFTYNSLGTYSVKLTATNASGNNTITRTNYITVTTNQPLGSVSFPGTSSPNFSAIYTQPNSVLAVGTGDFTIECWILLNSINDFNPICQNDSVGTSTSDKFYLGQGGGFLTLGAHGPGSPYSQCSFTPVINTWYHVAAVRTSSAVSIYINGQAQSVDNTVVGMTSQSFGQNGFSIGAVTSPYTLNGNISNIRLSNTAVYTGNFTVPTIPLMSTGSTILLTCRSPNDFADYGPNNLAFNASGSGTAPTATSLNPFN